jgi:hypothetical protein
LLLLLDRSYPGKIARIYETDTSGPFKDMMLDGLLGHIDYLESAEGCDIDDKYFYELREYLYNFSNMSIRTFELATIITKSDLSSTMQSHFKTIRQCYCYGEYDAAIVFCRALLEEVYQEKYGERYGRKLSLDVVITNARNEIKAGSSIGLDNKDCDRIKRINEIANSILHDVYKPDVMPGSSEIVFKTKGDTLVSLRESLRESMKDVALRCIKDTFFLIEKAF